MALECVPGESKVNPGPGSLLRTLLRIAQVGKLQEMVLEMLGCLVFLGNRGGLDLQLILWARVITVRQICWENNNFPKSCDFKKHFTHS